MTDEDSAQTITTFLSSSSKYSYSETLNQLELKYWILYSISISSLPLIPLEK